MPLHQSPPTPPWGLAATLDSRLRGNDGRGGCGVPACEGTTEGGGRGYDAGTVRWQHHLKRTDQPPRKPRFFYGWVIVFVAALGTFSSSTETFPVLSIFLKPITEEFGWSRAEFTGAISLGGLVGSGAALATGPIVDRFGPRWALTFAYTLIGVTFILMYFMSELWHLYALQIFARSMNTGVLAVASAVIVPNWFIIKRGKATALAGLGFPAGSSIMPLLIAFIAAAYSWREASLGAGILILIVSAVPTALLLRRRPEDMGLLPDGAPPEAARDMPARDLRVADRSMRLGQAARHPALYLLIIAISLWWFGRTGVMLHAVPYMTDTGLSDAVAVGALAVHSAIGALGAFAAGFLRDKFSVRYLIAIDFVMNAAAFALLLMVDTPLLAMAWGVFYGLSQGAAVTLQRLAFADYYGRRHLGSIEGVGRAFTNVTQAAGPLVAALVFDVTGSYSIIFTVFVGTNIAAAVLAGVAKPPRYPEEGEQG